MIANVHSEGYHFIFAEVLKLEHVVPAQRSRFIGVITKLAHVQWTPQHAGKVKRAFQGPLRSLQLESMWFAGVPAALMTQSLLTSQEIEIYSCVRRSPKQVATAKDALLRRVISPEARIPATSLMRSYTRQHLFHGVAHGTDKLLGDLRTQQDRLRFFTPVEIIAALGITNPVDLPLDIVSGSQQVGNSIAEVHALAGIWVAFVCCGFEFEGVTQSFEQILRKFRATRLDTQAGTFNSNPLLQDQNFRPRRYDALQRMQLDIPSSFSVGFCSLAGNESRCRQLKIMTSHANPAESFASPLFTLTNRQLLFRGNRLSVRQQRPSSSCLAPPAMTFMRFGDASGTAQTAEGGQPRRSQILCVQFWKRAEPRTPQFLLTPLKTRTPTPCPSPSRLFESFGSQKKSELQKPSPFTISTLDWFVGVTTLASELQNRVLMRCGRQSIRANRARPGFKSITNGDCLEFHRKQARMRSIGFFSCSRLMEKFYARLAPHVNSQNSPGLSMAIQLLQSRYMTTKSSLIRLLRASRNQHSDPEQMRLITFGRPRKSTSCRSQILGPGHRGQHLQASSFLGSARRMRCNCNSNRSRSQSCNPVCRRFLVMSQSCRNKAIVRRNGPTSCMSRCKKPGRVLSLHCRKHWRSRQLASLGSLIGRGGTSSGQTKPKEPDPKRAKSSGGVDMDQALSRQTLRE